MIRQDIKNAIQTCLQGTPGIKAVFATRQRVTQNQQTPCITVYLPDAKEEAVASGIPLGKRRIEFTAILEILMVDVNVTPEAGEEQFDNMLDEIDMKLRASFTLNGVVAGSAIKNLETHVSAPQLVEGQSIFRVAIKKFDITVNVVGTNNMGQYIYTVI